MFPGICVSLDKTVDSFHSGKYGQSFHLIPGETGRFTGRKPAFQGLEMSSAHSRESEGTHEFKVGKTVHIVGDAGVTAAICARGHGVPFGCNQATRPACR